MLIYVKLFRQRYVKILTVVGLDVDEAAVFSVLVSSNDPYALVKVAGHSGDDQTVRESIVVFHLILR